MTVLFLWLATSIIISPLIGRCIRVGMVDSAQETPP